ncbi:hypothetical protein ACFV3R_24455 [Streptomyces sp. NPDC059740]|uniref:hypothetical protein n=1 Tax=Streptomyces sp. NPDC059740 TaxID=3346926 RepID=UPI003668DB0A
MTPSSADGPPPGYRTETELRALALPPLLRGGLPPGSPGRTALFGEGAVAGALTLGDLGVLPRSVAFLAKVVRSGGVRYAADLSEPLPREEAATVVRGWLTEAAAVAPQGLEGDEEVARWLEAVAAVMELRLTSGPPATGRQD